jgi:hypothetical protein
LQGRSRHVELSAQMRSRLCHIAVGRTVHFMQGFDMHKRHSTAYLQKMS